MLSYKSIFSSRGRVFLLVIGFLIFLCYWGYNIYQGSQVRLDRLLGSMEKHGLPTKAWQQLSGEIIFQVQKNSEMVSAEYRREVYGHSVFLPALAYEQQNGYRFIRTIEDFVQMEIDGEQGGVVFGKIMHEFWHAYLEIYIKKQQPQSWEQIISWATPQFYDGTKRKIEPEYLEEVVDEAFGVKVERIYSEYIRFIAYQQKGWTIGVGERKRWSAAISDLFQGYYTKKIYGGLQKKLVPAKNFYHQGCADWLIFDILEGKLTPRLEKILGKYGKG